ncbi:acyl-CoA dehydrogenase family protein [Phytohabitans kaempferiae]|uniref:Acyl-CoA dehydrogenase family protein n=1 Tax=Phytohabitans kaempferiae TaxID=1620943 RepID=A0ABV6MGV4_9ACTN
MTVNHVDRDLSAMINAFLADQPAPTFSRSPQALRGRLRFDRSQWQELDALGLARLTTGTELGGSGAGLPEASILLSSAAYHGVFAPLAENDLLANWLLQTAGLPIHGGVRTACVRREPTEVLAVPWAGDVDGVVVLDVSDDGCWVSDLRSSDFQTSPGSNIAGEPRDDVRLLSDRSERVQVPRSVAEEFMLRGALARAIQMCGSMSRILELCVDHATTRQQFGRPISRFQAVQHLISDIAAETALARMATDAAVREVSTDRWDTNSAKFAIATARSCAGHASSVVVPNAHQVHGAIGTTLEHSLHLYTRSVLAWRSEFGSVSHWDDVAARLVTEQEDAWGFIVSGESPATVV